jgi:hypothetical protein
MKFIKPYKVYEATNIIQRGTDPYEYKVDNDNWLARKKGTTDWKEISGKDYNPNFQKSIDILDSENPNLRTEKAPNKTVGGGGSKFSINQVVDSPKEVEKASVEQEVPSGVGSVGQNMGFGKSFGDSQMSQYQTYKTNSKVYWAVYDIDNGKFLGKSSNSDQLVYAASVSKAVTGACALQMNGGTLPSQVDLDKLKLFLVNSNNDVWRHITQLAGGGDKINEWSKQMGWMMLPGNYLSKRISNKNSISASGMCLFWKDVLLNKFSGSAIIKKLSGSCRTSSTRSRVYIPKDCQIGGKTGLYEQYMHDSAWMITSSNRRFSITVLTELATASIVAVMFGGLFKEYCQGGFIQKTEVKKEVVSSGSSSGKLPIIFVAGLDNRSGDLSLEEQTEFVKSSLKNSSVTTFCAARSCKKHTDVSSGAAMKYLKENPNSIVLLFSAGTQYSTKASELISNKSNLFILEPYPQASSTVQGAVKNGVPSVNVIVGGSSGRGQGILSGLGEPTKTPSQYGHFPSLKFASQVISQK